MFTIAEPPSGADPSDVVLRLGGEIDILAADLVAEAGASVLDRTGTDLIIDFSDVTLIDSVGLGALVAIRNHAVESGRSVRVTGVQGGVERVFEITGLDVPFGISADG